MLILYTAYAMQGWIDRILIIRDGREIFLFFFERGTLVYPCLMPVPYHAVEAHTYGGATQRDVTASRGTTSACVRARPLAAVPAAAERARIDRIACGQWARTARGLHIAVFSQHDVRTVSLAQLPPCRECVCLHWKQS